MASGTTPLHHEIARLFFHRSLEAKRGWPPKFHAAHSSAALAVNAFAPWTKEPQSLALAGLRGFEEIRFEDLKPRQGITVRYNPVAGRSK